MQKAIWGTVAGIVIGNRVVILVQAEIVHIKAEVDIETAIAIVVGHRRMGECSLRGTGELEGIALKGEGAVALILEEQGAGATNYEKVLASFVIEVGKQGTCG